MRIVPKTAPVAASLLFDVTTDGQPLDDGAAFTLTAQPRNVDVVWTGSAPVTGVRKEPDATASGPIELRNASSEPLVVDQGTEVTTETGVAFVFAEAVTVPAADPATGRPGAATGDRAGCAGWNGRQRRHRRDRWSLAERRLLQQPDATDGGWHRQGVPGRGASRSRRAARRGRDRRHRIWWRRRSTSNRREPPYCPPR